MPLPPPPPTPTSPVLLSVRGPELQVDPGVENDERGEREHARDDELVPPRAEGDVVLQLVQARRLVVRVVLLPALLRGHRVQLELEELGDAPGAFTKNKRERGSLRKKTPPAPAPMSRLTRQAEDQEGVRPERGST